MQEATEHTEQLAEALLSYWGYDSFRPLQREAMECGMTGRDSVVVLPTGGGKSLCYQAPAACRDGVAVVVSPLISLMKDQVDALTACGIPAAALNSTLSTEEKRDITQRLREGEIKLLYAAPERLLLDGTLTFLTQLNVSFVAIDEAHCISAWGHDFRPEYRGLKVLREALPQVSMHAYTATASEKVRQDIASQLELRDPAMLVGSFDRPNLVYRVRRANQKLKQITDLVDRHRGESGIVYCISRKEVERTAEALRGLGVHAAPYHAGLSDQERHRNQEDFIEDRVQVIVATVAFGMGIDKPDVRFVAHTGLPKSVEHYQQESGRAGRDGLKSDCLLLFSPGDANTWRRMLASSDDQQSFNSAMQALNHMCDYANSVTCRHKSLVEFFGQAYEKDNCGACDVCLAELETVDEPLVLAQKIVSCVARLDQRFGGDYTSKVLAGSGEARILSSGHDRLSTYGLLKEYKPPVIRDWIEQLVGQGYLQKEGEYDVLQITETGLQLLKGDAQPRLLRPSAPAARQKKKASGDDWEGVDRKLFEKLRTLRGEQAAERGVPAYIVFGDTALRDMARLRPATLDAFSNVKGVGAKKLEDFGKLFVDAIADYCRANDVAPADPAPTVAARYAASEDDSPSLPAVAAFRHFREGLSIEETAAHLAKANSTVVGYLNQYLQHEQITDPTPWVERGLALRIEDAIEQVGLGRLKPIYEHLGGDVGYDEIRIVASCVANRG
ncbi:ATP-dependent DNA helicase RecQ [Posidoniimonas corsicana]|uniref:DNA helicase RecQ n=1 Tax=Posidoniimonas corsicana TaxID=1938618 RepID=A0A5C5UZV9_9BACT|nr:DNA helicase RecQ [Posidoniimonas corsicana]TWT31022.1 ATP-dependent DNA helicase RecQ [Posidoniimonas corsicana]